MVHPQTHISSKAVIIFTDQLNCTANQTWMNPNSELIPGRIGLFRHNSHEQSGELQFLNNTAATCVMTAQTRKCPLSVFSNLARDFHCNVGKKMASGTQM